VSNMSWQRIYRFPDHTVGDPVHAAINAWLDANGIVANDIPASARFIVIDGDEHHAARVQIEQFDMHVLPGMDRPIRTVNLLQNGYVKTERIYDMPVPISGFEPVAELVEV
jgi:hypothetical protein